MLTLPTQLTLREAPDLVKALQAQIAQGGGAVDIDASALQQIDSSALAVLLACRRAAGGRPFAVHSASARLRDLASLYGVQDLVGLAPVQA
ncbi:STAS domain-containing protein [Ideonella livida]|uniref:STAS domain-containing protein n=1 Tax=Ideonella livida TaxID=2707176 RepID=A0A7C9PI43_9BURK|nr:STAS domain-containing protein [Ideonella livida]NDY92368.1 STAS domain-containing protein [Ideonella livida]